jgi:EAL domain-containing protein (putative c-di-GMP-specific phosphodiesterase class I)
LDIALVRNVNADPARRALISSMVAFAAETNCSLVAEGVETDAELATLRGLGVAYGQGYLFGRPAPIEHLAQPGWLEAGTSAHRARPKDDRAVA